MLPTLTVPVVQSAPPLAPAAASSTWSQIAGASLDRDVAHGRSASDSTTVHVATDGKYLYVRFDAVQHEPIVASAHGNDLVAGGSNINGGIAWPDDAVWVDLWPTGPAGFQYQFESNPIGAHNEASTENTAFAPHWESYGSIAGGGYTVTMAIPLGVIHGAHAGTWRMQFVRYVRASGELDVWSSDGAQTNPDDPARAASVTVPLVARPPLPKPRAALYALGMAAAPSIGGSTSRTGLDFSIPVTQTSAFFGTLHPDYSNVELDQQSISPTVYQRIFSEVRPFFTQAAGYYNNFNCDVCNGFRTILYTPSIPTPREGYAFEGRQGDFGFAAFDAIRTGRSDAATALDYTSNDNRWNGAFEHVSANLPGLVDDANEAGLSWYNGKYLSFYTNFAWESGTNVSDRAQGTWLDGGGGWANQHFALFGSMRRMGALFSPVDGFDSHPGIAGYALYSARIWTFNPPDFLSSIGIDGVIDRYKSTTFNGIPGGIGQSDNFALIDFLTKSTIDVQLSTGSNYWLFSSRLPGSGIAPGSAFDGILTPISQSAGFSITYHSGMQNNINNFPAHGSSATPTSLSFNTGRYGNGRLDTWFRSSTLRVGSRGYVTLTVDNTAQYFPSAAPNVQWFDGASYAYQLAPNSSVAVGLRRVVGYPPQPNGGGNCLGVCSNISVAYHLRLAHEEIYAAYGDPNTLVTVPQAILKIIFYAGGEKGT
ncbi:MAG TPA: hypothetical protein VFA29_00525 [Candidatus Baltobacteraceae bacterium]|nr:hypothetical protein [Candidatus Baltobacteraceae bacterium]